MNCSRLRFLSNLFRINGKAVVLAALVFACAAPPLWLAGAQPIHAQEPIVQPGDVSTPAATPIALPSPTAAATGAPPPAGQTAGQTEGQTAGQRLDSPAYSHTGSEVTAAGMDATVGYTVGAGDTLLSVALETGLDLHDVPCAIAPGFQVHQPLVIGDVLSIPPASLACHAVVEGETLPSVAQAFGVSAEQIYLLPWNGLTGLPLEEVHLQAGTHLRVPLPLADFLWDEPLPANGPMPPGPASGAPSVEGMTTATFLPLMLSLPVDTSPFAVLGQSSSRPQRRQFIGPIPADWPYGSGRFAWPAYGWLSQSYRFDHRAIDVAANLGTPVTAADRGVVVRAGWNDQGYGQFVIIDHQIDYVTLYAHLDTILVKEGEVVGQGQVIGTVGSTGNSTGPHLHFEIRDFGRLANPLELLSLP